MSPESTSTTRYEPSGAKLARAYGGARLANAVSAARINKRLIRIMGARQGGREDVMTPER